MHLRGSRSYASTRAQRVALFHEIVAGPFAIRGYHFFCGAAAGAAAAFCAALRSAWRFTRSACVVK